MNQRLVNPWEDESAQPQAFAYRIHLGEMGKVTWAELKNDFLRPLAQQGVAFREVQLAA